MRDDGLRGDGADTTERATAPRGDEGARGDAATLGTARWPRELDDVPTVRRRSRGRR